MDTRAPPATPVDPEGAGTASPARGATHSNGTRESPELPTKPASNLASPAALDPTATADSAVDDAPASAEVARRRRGHRAASSVWRVLTLDAAPHLAIASVCRHCGARVPHHHKSEKARAHLVRCAAFREALLDADRRGDADFPRPDWLPDATHATRASRASNLTATGNDDQIRPHGTKRLKLTASGPTTTTHAAVSSPDPQAVVDALAMYMYTTGSPFADIENPHLQRALALASSSASAPAPRGLRAQDLTGAQLDRAFAAVQCELLRVTQRGGGAVNALCVNSWIPPAQESVYVVGDAAAPLFVDAEPALPDLAAAASVHVLFDRMARALTLCGDNIHGVVTDNSHANQLMWAKFKTIFPAKFFHGCAAHGLYLFVGEIFGSVARSSDGESPTTAFADLRRLVGECREIVAFFNGDDVSADVKAGIVAKMVGTRVRRLEMPPPGQWFELKAGFESVLVVLPLLQELVSAEHFTASGDKPLRERIASLVSQSDLEMLLFKAVALVDPLDTLMRRLERDPATPISDVFYWFAKELPVALSRVPGLTEDEAAFLLKLNQNRFNAMYGDSHGMAYLLDPRYVGEGLSPDVRKNIEDLIFQAPLVETANKDVNTDEQKVAIAQQLTEYVIDATKEKEANSFRYSILTSNKKSVLQYWLADGLRWPLLHRLAVRLFALPASTLPTVKKVLRVPRRLPNDELSPEVAKKIRFIQLNEVLLKCDGARSSDLSSAR